MKNNKKILLSVLSLFMIVSCKPKPSESLEPSSSETTSQKTSVVTYSITFYSEGGTDVASIIASPGEKVTKPSNPVRQGYTFIDWFTDKGTWQNAFIFDVMPEYNVVLYAKWEAISQSELDAYNATLAELSKPNHLYIHYLRFANSATDYDAWDIWVWPDKKTGRIFDFVYQHNKLYTDIYGGAMIEVDLTKTYTDGGHDGKGNKTNEQVNFSANEVLSERIGFLITYKASRSKGTHWTSDGGDKFFKTADALEHKINDSIHIFAVQENTRNFTFNYTGDEFVNPYENDDGTNVSAKYKNVNSSSTPEKISKTSALFKEKGVGYQIMVGSFADSDGDGFGDIRGIINSLDYLSSLNVEALWLTPVQLSDSYHGYDTIDYLNIDPKFGSKTSPHTKNGEVTIESANADYVELLSAAGDLGISVVMDLVLNHTSINNLLFQESLSLDPEFRAYYHWRNTKPNDNWYQYSNYNYYYYGKFASSMPEFNYDYQKTRDKIVDIMQHWVDLGVAGFRIDAVKHIYMEEEVTPESNDVIIVDDGNSAYNSNLTKNLHFFRELNARLKENNPNVFIVGENFDGHAYNVAPYYEGLDGMLNFHMYYNLTEAARLGQTVEKPAEAAILSGAFSSDVFNAAAAGLKYGGNWNYPGTLNAYNLYRDDVAIDNNFTSNHDINRAINQASGLTNITASTKKQAENQVTAYMAASLLLPGVTWIYYGDELGLASNMPSGSTINSPNIDRIYRQPMKWDQDGSDVRTTEYSFSGAQTYDVAWDTYNKTVAGVSEQSANTSSMLETIRKVTALKKNTLALKQGNFAPISADKYHNLGRIFAFTRTYNNETYEIYVNFSMHECGNIPTIGGNIVLTIGNATKTHLDPWSVLVVKR